MKCKWIKVKVGVFNDEKIKLIETQKSRNSILIIFFKLLDLAGSINDEGKILMDSDTGYTVEELKVLLNRDEREVKNSLEVLEKYGIIQREKNNIITITNWSKYQDLSKLEEARTKSKLRKRAQRSREKERALEEAKEEEDELETIEKEGNEILGHVTNVTGERREEKRKEEKIREEKNRQEDIVCVFECLTNTTLLDTEKNLLLHLEKSLGSENIKNAIEIGVLNNKPNLKYIQGVAKRLLEKEGLNGGGQIYRGYTGNTRKDNGKGFKPQKPKTLSEEEYRRSEGELI